MGVMMQSRVFLLLSVLAVGLWAMTLVMASGLNPVAAQPDDKKLMELMRQAFDGCRVEGEIVRERLLRDRDVIRAHIRCSPSPARPVRLPTR